MGETSGRRGPGDMWSPRPPRCRDAGHSPAWHPVHAWTLTGRPSAGPHWRRVSACLLLLLLGRQVVSDLLQVNIIVMK